MSEEHRPAQAVGDEERDQFIPIRKSDVLNRLIETGQLGSTVDQQKFRQLCRLLGSIFHYEYFDRLEELRDDYYYFNPELPADGRTDIGSLQRTREEFVANLESVLKGANYTEIPQGEIDRLHQERKLLRVKVEAKPDTYHVVRFFRRGHHLEMIDTRKWFGLRQNLVETSVFDNVVLMVTTKHREEIASKRDLKRLAAGNSRPGSILIKHFRNIAASDLCMLLPKVKVVMSLVDKLTIAVPALAGGIPLLINLLPTLTVLVLVAGFYLGLTQGVAHDDVVKAFAAVSGLAALGGVIMRQRLKYERLSLKYQKQISDHFYYRNVSNNGGIFDYIVGSAEEQECKEAFLAYYFLLTANDPPDQATLDARIEAWLKESFGVDIDFEVDDALAKLSRLDILRRNGDKLAVLPLDEALIVLDRIWDNFFPFSNDAAEPPPRRALRTA